MIKILKLAYHSFVQYLCLFAVSVICIGNARNDRMDLWKLYARKPIAPTLEFPPPTPPVVTTFMPSTSPVLSTMTEGSGSDELEYNAGGEGESY